jgi:hypothetical protein
MQIWTEWPETAPIFRVKISEGTPGSQEAASPGAGVPYYQEHIRIRKGSSFVKRENEFLHRRPHDKSEDGSVDPESYYFCVCLK